LEVIRIVLDRKSKEKEKEKRKRAIEGLQVQVHPP